jgi:Spy/CpxP family protein refolding chaperone
MRKATWLVLALALAVLVAAPALLAEEAKAPKEGKAKAAAKESSGLKGEYAIMAGELKFTDAQKADLAAKVKAKAEALNAWETANGEKLKAAQETLKKARESGDKQATGKAAEELKTLRGAMEKIQADATAAIHAILTPEQQQAWEGFSLYRQAMARYKKVGLAEDQQNKIRELCNAAGKEVATGKAKDEVRKTLDKDIAAVLTPAQKEALKPAEKAAGDKAGAEKKKSAEK